MNAKGTRVSLARAASEIRELSGWRPQTSQEWVAKRTRLDDLLGGLSDNETAYKKAIGKLKLDPGQIARYGDFPDLFAEALDRAGTTKVVPVGSTERLVPGATVSYWMLESYLSEAVKYGRRATFDWVLNNFLLPERAIYQAFNAACFYGRVDFAEALIGLYEIRWANMELYDVDPFFSSLVGDRPAAAAWLKSSFRLSDMVEHDYQAVFWELFRLNAVDAVKWLLDNFSISLGYLMEDRGLTPEELLGLMQQTDREDLAELLSTYYAIEPGSPPSALPPPEVINFLDRAPGKPYGAPHPPPRFFRFAEL